MLAARWHLSPNFIPPVAVFLVSGILLFTGSLYTSVGVFVFVLSGWIISLCLHEAAHALAGWYGGDRSVLGRGYLSLDPLVYAHRDMTFIMPILFLLLGGIGLPGGAVYIDKAVLKSKGWDAFVSLAGPLANLAFFLALALPFLIGIDRMVGEPIFWSAIAFLAALQVSAAVLSLMPIPGLDGFGVLMPYLPHALQMQALRLAQMLGFVLLLLFLSPGFSSFIWGIVLTFTDAVGISRMEIISGMGLFRFWR